MQAATVVFNPAQVQASAESDPPADAVVRPGGDEPEFGKVFTESLRQAEHGGQHRVKGEADAAQASKPSESPKEQPVKPTEQGDQEQAPADGTASTENAPPEEAAEQQPTVAPPIPLTAFAGVVLPAAEGTVDSAGPSGKVPAVMPAPEAPEQDVPQVRAAPSREFKQASVRAADRPAQQSVQPESSEGDARGRAGADETRGLQEMPVPAVIGEEQAKPGRGPVLPELAKSVDLRALPDADARHADRKPADAKPDAPSAKPPAWPGSNEPSVESQRIAPRQQPAGQPQAEPTPVVRLQDVVQVIRPNLQQGHSQLRLQLHPPQLGQLRIDVDLREHVLTLELRAESSQVREFLLSRLPELRHSLESHGISLDRFHVEVRPPEQPQPGREHFTADDQRSADRWQDGGRQTASHGQADSFESTAATSALDEASDAEADVEPSTPATESSVDLVA